MGDTFTDALRLAAEWFDAHPTVPRPAYAIINVQAPDSVSIPALVRQLAGFKKQDYGNTLTLHRTFGPEIEGVRVDFNFQREQVCERKVVGTRDVPERIIPAHTEEVVEWECLPMLAERESDG
jgi:hypothetical protein